MIMSTSKGRGQASPSPASRLRGKRACWRPVRAAMMSAVVGVLAAGLLTAAGVSSYDSLWRLAADHHVPVPHLSPLELDGGLVVVTLLDIAFTWGGYPLGGLRFLARVLGVGTIAANVAAGWPDPVGAFLRAFAPAIIVAVTEAVRAVLLRRNTGFQEARKRRRESRIPLARWLLAPWPTFVLWRRMRLWDITGYRAAVDMELSRRQAVVRLEMRFGRGWESAAPADLVWMLHAGVHMDEALQRVAELCAPVPVPEPEPGRRKGGGTTARNRKRKPAGTRGRNRVAAAGVSSAPQDSDLDAEALILRYIAEGHSPSAAGRMAGRSDSYGRQIARKLAKPAPQGVDGKRGAGPAHHEGVPAPPSASAEEDV